MTDAITLPRAKYEAMCEALKLIALALPLDKSTVKSCYAINNMHRDVVHSALAQQVEQGWVSLNDGLPQPHQMVLVARGKLVTTGSYSPEFGWEWEQLDGEDDDSVATHWMPLPASPKETK